MYQVRTQTTMYDKVGKPHIEDIPYCSNLAWEDAFRLVRNLIIDQQDNEEEYTLRHRQTSPHRPYVVHYVKATGGKKGLRMSKRTEKKEVEEKE